MNRTKIEKHPHPLNSPNLLMDNNDIHNAEEYDSKQQIIPLNNALSGYLPPFNSKDHIIWYQYLIFVTREKKQFYVTFPAELCWNIEGQWIKFQQNYALNPYEAEKTDSKFTIDRYMIGDLLNMKVSDKSTGHEYELKRTETLIGTILQFGFIEFESTFRAKMKQIYVYDLKTGIGKNCDFRIGDKVSFEAFWNMNDENNNFIHDFSSKLPSKIMDKKCQKYKIMKKMIAFNVNKYVPLSEEEQLNNLDPSKISYLFDDTLNHAKEQNLGINPLVPDNLSLSEITLAEADPLIADDFKNRRFTGLVITIRSDETGLIVCYPFDDDIKRDLTLLFHLRFVRKHYEKNRLFANSLVTFSIGVNPINFGVGLYGYVAMEIEIHKDKNYQNIQKNLPLCTQRPIERKYKGQIVIAPKEKKDGFVYNEYTNNMTRICVESKEKIYDFRQGMFVRFNECKKNQNKRVKYVAFDVINVEKVDNVSSYYTNDNFVKFNAKRYVIDQKLKIDEDRNIEFKKIGNERYYADIFLIIEQAETYLNAFLNTSGGAIFFGIRDDGTIAGQANLTKNKQNYIRSAIKQRANHFIPSVPSNFYRVEFKEIVDCDGFVIPNLYVIVVHAAKLDSSNCMEQHVKFQTSEKQIYQRRITSVGTDKSQLLCLRPQEHQVLYAKRHELGIKDEVHIGIKPFFYNFDEMENENDINGNNDMCYDEDEKESEEETIGTMTNGMSENDKLHQKAMHEVIVADDENVLVSDTMNHSVPIVEATDGTKTICVPPTVIDEDVLNYTTPTLNAKPIPSNTQKGVEELRQNVGIKMKEMMQIEEYILDKRWQTIQRMASFVNNYNALKSAWFCMKNLENEKIKESIKRKQQKQYSQYNEVQVIAEEMDGPLVPIRDISTKQLINEFVQTRMAATDDGSGNTTKGPTPNDFITPGATMVNINQTNVNAVPIGCEDGIFGLPLLSDKSKYKSVAIQWCQKMGWQKPTEVAQLDHQYGRYRATVSFGKLGEEKSACGQGQKQKVAIYEAYVKLLPKVIPKEWAVEAISKWLPGRFGNVENLDIGIQPEPVFNAEQVVLPPMKHPKSILLEWAQKNSIAPAKTSFEEFVDNKRNLRVWTAKVTFCGKAIESRGVQKKDAEKKCFAELVKMYVK